MGILQLKWCFAFFNEFTDGGGSNSPGRNSFVSNFVQKAAPYRSWLNPLGKARWPRGGVPEKNASTTPKDAGQKLRAPQKWVRGVGAIYGLKRQIIAQNDVQWRLFIPILERVCEEYPTLKELVDLTFIAEQMHLKRSKTKSILKSLL